MAAHSDIIELSHRRSTEVDEHVGRRMRALRRQRGASQEWLARKLGISFQQIQKYERGSNRVSASKLFEVAGALAVPISYFFEGLAGVSPQVIADRGEDAIHAFLKTDEGVELARTFPLVPSGRLRQRVLELVRSIVETGTVAPAGKK